MFPRRLFFSAILFTGLSATAQKAALLDSVNFYGSLRAVMAAYDQTVEMQNNGSRIGFVIQRKNKAGFTAEGKIELGLNLLKNNTSFNPGNATADDPSSFLTETVKPVTTRQGYIGLSSKKWGTLRIGKQWGVYYDVSAFTDGFEVFGATALGTFNTGTDGGGEGTGRAESAIKYIKAFRDVTLGLQAQIPGHTVNFGGSLLYRLPYNLTFGAAYNYYQIPEILKSAVINSREVASSVVVALRYSNSGTYVAASFAYNESETQNLSDTAIVGFSANGFEIYAHQYLTETIKVSAGVNYLVPASSFFAVPDSYRLFTIPVGASWNVLPDFLCFTELQINKNISIKEKRGNNIFTLGIRYGFNFGKSAIRIMQ